MKNPADLRAALLAAMQGITAFAALVPAGASEYTEAFTGPDLYSAIQQMKSGSAMIAWRGTDIGARSNGIAHSFSVYLKPGRGQSAAAMFIALREGVVASSGEKFKRHQVDPLCHFPDVLGCSLQQILIGDAVLQYHEVPIRLTERGVDS